jgi:hypothetical protein
VLLELSVVLPNLLELRGKLVVVAGQLIETGDEVAQAGIELLDHELGDGLAVDLEYRGPLTCRGARWFGNTGPGRGSYRARPPGEPPELG